MPIRIEKINSESKQRIDWICDDEWEMPKQIEALEAWLSRNADQLEKGEYVADLGFSPRENACGGGTCLSPSSMELMAKVGMYLWLSEYPTMVEE